MVVDKFFIGQRVKLVFYPYCIGTITEIVPGITVGVQLTGEKAVVRWDKDEYETSKPLGHYDLAECN